jgi:hypothetical protein
MYPQCNKNFTKPPEQKKVYGMSIFLQRTVFKGNKLPATSGATSSAPEYGWDWVHLAGRRQFPGWGLERYWSRKNAP